MGATKGNTEIDNWTPTGTAALVKGSEADVSTLVGAGLLVTVGHMDANANALGALVIVQGRVGANDEDWRDLYSIRMAAGTADTTTLDAEATSPTAVIPLAATGDFQTLGQKALIVNGTAADSEVVMVKSWSAGVSITAVDDLKNTQQNGLSIFSIVAEKFFPLPDGLSTARVLVINDDADAALAFRVDLVGISSVA